MGVYNIEKIDIIDSMMNSILRQTYSDLEFIICDDGSNDKTYEIMNNYAILDERIILIKNSVNRGLAYSLNECLKIANGDFIARQDADDISDLKRFEKQVTFLENNPHISFVGSNVYLFDKEVWGSRVLKKFPQNENFLFGSPFVHGTIMFRKSALIAVENYRVSKETYRVEDYDLFMRLYKKNFLGANIQENLYYYQESKQNISKRKYKYRFDEVKIRYKGFKMLNLLPKGYIYILKPLIVGLIPNKLLTKLKFKYNIFKKE